ncbi:MAG TPA: DUF2793 domain-containing protein [Methylophilaceae bacterium]
MSTPNLGLELVPSNSLQPSVAINDALQLLDALVQLAVESRTLTAPPATTESDIGKRWIIGTSATGAWAGHDGEIALCTGADLWRFIEPREGFEGWDIGAGERVRYTSGAWVAV